MKKHKGAPRARRKGEDRPRISPRAKLERTLGHKLLTGEIPVVPPSQLPRCPIPPTHVKDFESLCQAYADGKISEADVIAKVNESLKALKKPIQEEKQ